MSSIHDMMARKEDITLEVKLIGIAPVKFTASNGNTILGTRIFCAFRDPNVEGFKTEKFFLREEIQLPECKLNETLNLSFDMHGKVEAVYKA